MVMIRRLLISEARKFMISARHERTRALSALSQFSSSPTKWSSAVSHAELSIIPNQAVCLVSRRNMASVASRDLFYDDIVKLSSNNEIVLIDVREPVEIQETGKLPGSTHIPLGDIPNALSLDDNTFKEKYGTEKPGKDSPIVFSCRSGKRSFTALEKALALGYSNSRHYAGGWLDWEKNTKN